MAEAGVTTRQDVSRSSWHKQRGKCRRGEEAEVNLDDSSDEEEEKALSSYDIAKNYKEYLKDVHHKVHYKEKYQFKKAREKTTYTYEKFLEEDWSKKEDKRYKLSFLQHALGLKLYYSLAVEENYRPLKRDVLRGDPVSVEGDPRVPRATLADEYALEVPRDRRFSRMLARTRLSNRSHKRHIRNLRDRKEGVGILRVDRKWRFEGSEEVVSDLQFSSSTGRSVEESSKMLKMDSMIQFQFCSEEGAEEYSHPKRPLYSELPELIDNIKERSGLVVEDKTIARWIRSTLHGEPVDKLKDEEEKFLKEVMPDVQSFVKENLHSFVVLLFGCEVSRSPAALISNSIMLNEIEEGGKTWKNFFKERKMPMSMKGAIRAARVLHKEYDRFMPYHYKYEGLIGKGDGEALKEKESLLMRTWLERKTPDMSPDLPIEELYRKIKTKERALEWFGEDFGWEEERVVEAVVAAPAERFEESSAAAAVAPIPLVSSEELPPSSEFLTLSQSSLVREGKKGLKKRKEREDSEPKDPPLKKQKVQAESADVDGAVAAAAPLLPLQAGSVSPVLDGSSAAAAAALGCGV